MLPLRIIQRAASRDDHDIYSSATGNRELTLWKTPGIRHILCSPADKLIRERVQYLFEAPAARSQRTKERPRGSAICPFNLRPESIGDIFDDVPLVKIRQIWIVIVPTFSGDQECLSFHPTIARLAA